MSIISIDILTIYLKIVIILLLNEAVALFDVLPYSLSTVLRRSSMSDLVSLGQQIVLFTIVMLLVWVILLTATKTWPAGQNFRDFITKTSTNTILIYLWFADCITVVIGSLLSLEQTWGQGRNAVLVVLSVTSVAYLTFSTVAFRRAKRAQDEAYATYQENIDFVPSKPMTPQRRERITRELGRVAVRVAMLKD